MDRSQKDKILADLTDLQQLKKEGCLPRLEDFKTHLSNIKVIFNKKKLMALWLQKILSDSNKKQIFMKEASETSNKMKTFEQNLREEFSCVIKKKLSKSSLKEEVEESMEFERMLTFLKDFVNFSLENFLKEQAKTNSVKILKRSNEQKPFLKSDHVLLNIVLEMIVTYDTIENELKEIFANKFYLKFFITNYSQELLDARRAAFLDLISQEHISALINYYKFIKKALESIEFLDSFSFGSVGLSKISDGPDPKFRSLALEKTNLCLSIKKSESTFHVHGNAFSLTSNGESPMLSISPKTSSIKEQEIKKNEPLQNFSYSRTTSINSLKYYDENKSDFTFQCYESQNNSPFIEKKVAQEKMEERHKRCKSAWCSLFGCGFV